MTIEQQLRDVLRAVIDDRLTAEELQAALTLIEQLKLHIEMAMRRVNRSNGES